MNRPKVYQHSDLRGNFGDILVSSLILSTSLPYCLYELYKALSFLLCLLTHVHINDIVDVSTIIIDLIVFPLERSVNVIGNTWQSKDYSLK